MYLIFLILWAGKVHLVYGVHPELMVFLRDYLRNGRRKAIVLDVLGGIASFHVSTFFIELFHSLILSIAENSQEIFSNSYNTLRILKGIK